MIFESMAYNFASVVEKIESMTGKEYRRIHIVSGGSRNDLVNSLTASVTGKVVCAGPHEATTVGNALVQMMALGEVSDLSEARDMVKNSFEIRVYEPENHEFWRERYETWRKVVGR